jgi:hypothetical protein
MPSNRSTHAALVSLAFIVIAFILATPCRAQDIDSPKFVYFAGAGTNLSRGHALGEIQAGASFEESTPNHWIGYGFEGGYVGPWSRLKSGAGLFSFNYTPSWSFNKQARFLPFATVGYTHLFGTSNAVNFGCGLDLRLSNTRAIRFEVRDYYSPVLPQTARHDVAFRIGWVIYLWD